MFSKFLRVAFAGTFTRFAMNRERCYATEDRLKADRFTLSNDLFEAIFRHRFQTKLKRAIEYGFDIDTQSVIGVNILMNVCCHGKLNDVEYVLSLNPILDKCDIDKQNALHHAMYNNNPAIVELLLKKGFCINQKNINNSTPLQMCCRLGGNVEIVKVLLANGAEITPGCIKDAQVWKRYDILELFTQTQESR